MSPRYKHESRSLVVHVIDRRIPHSERMYAIGRAGERTTLGNISSYPSLVFDEGNNRWGITGGASGYGVVWVCWFAEEDVARMAWELGVTPETS